MNATSLVVSVVVALAVAVVCVRDVRVVSASQSRELAASPPRRRRRAARISLLTNTYSVLVLLHFAFLHILSTPYLYYCTCTYCCLAWPRDSFHARRISLVIVARPSSLLM